MSYMFKLKPGSMSIAQYLDELIEFNGDEILRHDTRIQSMRDFWLAGVKNV